MDEILSKIDNIALSLGWTIIDYQRKIEMASWRKEGMRINVYLTTMSVATCLNHPKKGKTQLFRRDVNLKTLEAIFKNPRQHTGKGYYEKRNRTKTRRH